MSRPVTDHDYELLSAYLDGALSESERLSLETRLQNEPFLRYELDALRQTVTLVKKLPPLKAPRNFTLDTAMVRPSRLLIFPTTTAFSALSAIAAILVLVAAGFLFLSQPLASRQFAPAEPQSIASNPTQAITAASEDDNTSTMIIPTAIVVPPTHAPSPFDTPEEAAGAAAMDEQESADALVSPPTATLVPPSAGMAAPVTAGEDQGAQSEPDSQSQQTMEQMQAAPTQMLGTTTLSFAATPSGAEGSALDSTANRLLTEEATSALSDGYTVAQAESTPELQENEEAPSPAMTATLSPTTTPVQDGRFEDRGQGSQPIPLANVLLAVGLLLLILAVATTIARRRR